MIKGKVKMWELYKPISDYVLVPYKETDKTPGGVIIPEAQREKQFFMEVLAAGPDTRTVEVGDFIIMAPGAKAAVFEIAGSKYCQVREMDLFAVVTAELMEMDRAIQLERSGTPFVDVPTEQIQNNEKKAQLTIVPN